MKRKDYTQPQFEYIELKQDVLAISAPTTYDQNEGIDLVTPGSDWWA